MTDTTTEAPTDGGDAGDDDLSRIDPQDRRPSGRWNSVGVPVERSNNLGAVTRRLLRLLGAERARIFLIVGASVLAVTLNMTGPELLGHGTNLIISGVTHHHIDFHHLDVLLGWALLVYGGSGLCSLVTAYMITGVVQRLMYRLRRSVEDKVHALPLAYIDQGSRGDLLSRVTNDIDNISQSLQQTLSQMLNSTLMLVGAAALMFVISPLLALAAMTTVPVSLFAVKKIAGRAQPRYIEQWRSTGALNGIVEEAFTGHAIVKAFGRQEDVEATFTAKNEELFRASFGAQFMSSAMQPITNFLGNIQYVIVAVVGGLQVASGTLSLGSVQAFIQYARNFSMPVTQLASMANVFQSGMASLERVFDLLDVEEEPDDSDAAPTPAGPGRVVFDDIRFSYHPDVALIEDLSLVAEPGRTVAIVGPTGAGKTTLVNLLMRFYDLSSGQISVDGREIASMRRADLRSRTGMVLQDTWLFGGTIRDNIAYGNPDASESEILAAGTAAYVDRFAHSLPDGYDTLINEEADNLSAGQRQLITIARAFLANPTILILDEATSSVDTRTEVHIQQAMNRLRADRTSFVIAHRLSTIRGADVILVMEKGRIVEQGSHRQLIAAGGAYARLYAYQFGAPAADVE